MGSLFAYTPYILNRCHEDKQHNQSSLKADVPLAILKPFLVRMLAPLAIKNRMWYCYKDVKKIDRKHTSNGR